VFVRGPERLHAWRVVADPQAIDALDAAIVLRVAPDDVLVLDDAEPVVGDAHAIVVPERGFVGWELGPDEVIGLGHGHVEWELPSVRPAMAQGLVAQVPAKLWLRDDGSALLICAAALATELKERLA
jgi:hypothetical protein